MKRGGAALAVVSAAVLFSTAGAAIKIAAFSTAQVSAVRSGVAALTLLLWLGRRLTWSFRLVGIGAIYAATLTLFVVATRLTTAANAIFLQSTFPVFMLLLAPWLLKERITRGDVVSVAVMAAGIVLCFHGRAAVTATTPNPLAGNLAGLAAGVAWALTIAALRHLERETHADAVSREGLGLSAVVAGNGIACVVALPWALPLPHATAAGWGTLVYLGVFQVALAYVCLTRGIRRLPAMEASLLLLIEPVLNPIWAWLVRGENPGVWVLAGGAVIIGASAVKSVWKSTEG
ncbi:MAG TPA: EamA family transporter [Vicinamibacterales bacterium]|nr:EamA family transporter [Vicinamibacterales bacterium]